MYILFLKYGHNIFIIFYSIYVLYIIYYILFVIYLLYLYILLLEFKLSYILNCPTHIDYFQIKLNML